jgi:HEXXH motif-containing protein
MELTSHHVSRETFLDLARGLGGSKAVAQLAAVEHSKHLLLIRGVLDVAEKTGHHQAADARYAYDLLAAIQDHHPAPVESVIRHPAVGAWALRTLARLMGEEGARSGKPAELARLAAAAALMSGVDFSIRVPVDSNIVLLPSAGRILLPVRSDFATVHSAGRIISLDINGSRVAASTRGLRDLRGWQAIRSMQLESNGLSLALAVDDIDPYRMPAASPADRLTVSEFFIWRRRLAEAWELLTRYHRPAATEVCAVIRVLTPLRTPRSGIHSVTSHENFGAVGMSLPSDALTAAVTMIHEAQHAKLMALLDHVAMTRRDDGRRFYAPWRSDPRPASGLLQGAYAYLGVSGFWRRQRHIEDGNRAILAHAEFARWRKAAEEVARVLAESGALTREGHMFVAGMLATLRSWNTESIPAQALEIAKHNADEHAMLWRLRNPMNSD